MYTDAAVSGRSRAHHSLQHSPLFGLGMRAIPVSYRRLNFPGLYPVGTAPPAHQQKAVVSPQVNVQPAHQSVSGLLSAHVGPSSLPAIPDWPSLIPPMFRIPSMAYSGGSQPSLGAAGGIWGQNGSCSRCPAVAGKTSQAVDPNTSSNHVTGVLANRPTASYSAACVQKSFVPPPVAHRMLPSFPPGAGSRSAVVPVGGGSHSTLAPPQHGSHQHSHHTMFFARVLVGRSAIGRSDYRTPPPLDPSDQFGRCFDSCVNRPIDPSIYVIFNSAQCYPEYLIEYVNKSKSAEPVWWFFTFCGRKFAGAGIPFIFFADSRFYGRFLF